MPRCSAASRSDAALTSVRGPTLTAAAGRDLILREVGIFNTTTTAVAVALKRATTPGTAGTGLNEVSWASGSYTPVGLASNTNTADHTAGGGTIMQATLGAAAGAGVIWTFGGDGLWIPADDAVFIFLPTGSTQVIDFYFVWDE